MHKYITLFFSVTFFLSACKGDKPNGIIDHNHMISLLTEVHIIDGRIYSLNQSPDTLYKYGLGMYIELFKKYHTDTLHFNKSMRYYANRPIELDAIYVQVQKNIKQISDSLIKVQVDSNKVQNYQKVNQAQQKNNNALPKK